MSDKCKLVVFSDKAYNAIIRESFDKDPVETGGIFLGHILDNGVWIVMEVLPPGINSIFQYSYFEYDTDFVNYLAQSVASQYKKQLDLLGLWHRHPGHMNVFSSTDNATNKTFARLNPQGVISGLVNIDPDFRLTMYHMNNPIDSPFNKPYYNIVEVEVGDDIIPEEYFELRYYNGENSNLHPSLTNNPPCSLNNNIPLQPPPTQAPNDINNKKNLKWVYILLVAIVMVCLVDEYFGSHIKNNVVQKIKEYIVYPRTSNENPQDSLKSTEKKIDKSVSCKEDSDGKDTIINKKQK